MKTIIIDDEPWMLKLFSDECVGLDEIELVGSFRNPLKALEYAQSNTVDLAVIDMVMPQMSGAETAKRLGEIWKKVKIIIISAYEDCCVDTLREYTDYGYLRKPYKRDDLLMEIIKKTSK